MRDLIKTPNIEANTIDKLVSEYLLLALFDTHYLSSFSHLQSLQSQALTVSFSSVLTVQTSRQ